MSRPVDDDHRPRWLRREPPLEEHRCLEADADMPLISRLVEGARSILTDPSKAATAAVNLAAAKKAERKMRLFRLSV